MKSDTNYMQSKMTELDKKNQFMETQQDKYKEGENRHKKVLEENQFMKMQIESINRQMDRKIKELSESDFQMKLVKAENQHLKKEIADIDDRFREAKKEYQQMEEKMTSQQMQIMKLKALSDE